MPTGQGRRGAVLAGALARSFSPIPCLEFLKDAADLSRRVKKSPAGAALKAEGDRGNDAPIRSKKTKAARRWGQPAAITVAQQRCTLRHEAGDAEGASDQSGPVMILIILQLMLTHTSYSRVVLMRSTDQWIGRSSRSKITKMPRAPWSTALSATAAARCLVQPRAAANPSSAMAVFGSTVWALTEGVPPKCSR